MIRTGRRPLSATAFTTGLIARSHRQTPTLDASAHTRPTLQLARTTLMSLPGAYPSRPTKVSSEASGGQANRTGV